MDSRLTEYELQIVKLAIEKNIYTITLLQHEAQLS